MKWTFDAIVIGKFNLVHSIYLVKINNISS